MPAGRSPWRGPDEVELALGAFTRAVLDARRVDESMIRAADEIVKAQARLVALGIGRPSLDLLSREFTNVLRMRSGVPYWDREVAKPLRSVG
jgi:hypothetical protein